MFRHMTVLITFLIALMPALGPANQYGTSTSLPQDILFTAGITTTDGNKIALIRLDRITGQTTQFYSDTEAEQSFIGLRALTWSSRGKYLAIRRIKDRQSINDIDTEVCILTQMGILKRCLSQRPSNLDWDGELDQLSFTQWSTDERYFYFVAKSDSGVKLIEVDVETGETTRELYTTNRNARISWTADLVYILEGASSVIDPSSDLPIYVYSVNRQTGVRIEISSTLSATRKTVCPGLSPVHGYIVAYTTSADSSNTTMVIFDKSGTIVETTPLTPAMKMSYLHCPSWANNDDFFLFIGYSQDDPTALIYKYTLSTRTWQAVYRAVRNAVEDVSSRNVGEPLLLSSNDAIFMYKSQVNGPRPGIKVISDGTLRSEIQEPYDFARYPIWMPSQPEVRLMALCSRMPDLYRIWRINNMNPTDTVVNWEVVGTSQKGVVLAKAAADTIFQTSTITNDTNTVRISVNGVVQDTQVSDPSQCVDPSPTPAPTFTPTIGPTQTPTVTPTPSRTPSPTLPPLATKLRLTSLCSPNPIQVRVWRVRNSNTFDVPFTWDVYGTQQKGTGIASANADVTFQTATVANSPNTVRVFVNGVLQDTKASGTTQCTP